MISNPIKPMLALDLNSVGNLDIIENGDEWYLSPKIDGIRALNIDNEPMSRSGKKHRNIYLQNKFLELPNIHLDGEVLNCNEFSDFGSNTKDIMSIKNELPNLSYHIFDIVNDKKYEERLNSLRELILPEWCVIVPSYRVDSASKAREYIEDFISQGYEGGILRTNSLYKQGRATKTKLELIKVKNFADCEGVITDIAPLYRNHNKKEKNELGYTKRSLSIANLEETNLLGSFKCRVINGDYIGQVVSVGTGFSQAQREEYYSKDYIGKIIKLKYFNVGVKDTLRHPVFLGFRDDSDF